MIPMYIKVIKMEILILTILVKNIILYMEGINIWSNKKMDLKIMQLWTPEIQNNTKIL